MPNALYAFEDADVARRAMAQLSDAGLAPGAAQLHVHVPSPHASVRNEFDEVATGGFVTNFVDLFANLFEWGGSPHDPTAFADTVHAGGAVVAVDASSREEQQAVDRVMDGAAPQRRSGWSATAA